MAVRARLAFDIRLLFAYDRGVRENAIVWLSENRRWHSHTVSGLSLFEVAGWALAHFLSNGYLTPAAIRDSILCVQTETGNYQVRAARIERWLQEVDDDFRSRLVKQQIWLAMRRS